MNVGWAWDYWNNSENNLEGYYMMTDLLNMKDCDLNQGWLWNIRSDNDKVTKIYEMTMIILLWEVILLSINLYA